MKITFILKHAYISGGDRVIATHARELKRRGHIVNIISTPWPRLPVKDRIRNWLGGQPASRPIGIVPSSFDAIDVPHHVTNSSRPIVDADVPDADVVIATWWETAHWVAALSPAKGAKAFFIQHYETWGGDPDRVDAAWRLPLHKIVISHWLRDFAREKFGDSDVSHVPNSVDMNLFHAPPRSRQQQPTVGMLYSAMPFKGCDIALKAIEKTRQRFPNLRLISFGERPPEPELPLPDYAQFTLRPAQDKIKDLYAQCDVWLCGSRAEGFHLPPLEAMACRCPVVSTKVGGPLDTIESGRNGFLVDVEDDRALAERLIEVLGLSDAAWLEMSDAAHATASRYTWQDAGRLLERALEAAIEKENGTKAHRHEGTKG